MKIRFLTILIFLTSWSICSQEVNFNLGSTKEKNYFEEISYESVYDKVVIPVVINGKEFRFLLDTGAPNVISKKVLEELNLINTKKINVSDANNLEQSMQAVEIPKIKIGNLTFENQVALVYDLENHNILSCFKIDGFVGSNLLKKSILKISKADQKIIITDQIKKLNPSKKPTKIKIIGNQKSPYIEFRFTGKNKEIVSDMVLIDTGMDGFYEMSNRANKIFEEYKVFEVIARANGVNSLGLFGAGNPTPQNLLKVETAVLNSTKIKNLIINTTDDNNSRIGLDFLNYGDLIIDFKNKKAYFESDDTITLESLVPKYASIVKDNKYVVGLVWDEELAKQMSFGDEIISIDSYKINEMSFCEILKLKKEWKNKSNYSLTIKNKENKITTITIEN
mgnify:FL=1